MAVLPARGLMGPKRHPPLLILRAPYASAGKVALFREPRALALLQYLYWGEGDKWRAGKQESNQHHANISIAVA